MRLRRLVTSESIAKLIAEGRGHGEGAEYQPWHFIQDFPSLGRVHRIKGWLHGRVHHLFSDLELYVFFAYQWPRHLIIDIREQYPLLPLEETVAIAKDLGIRHPADTRTKHPVVLTTDFFLTLKRNLTIEYVARTAKYMQHLLDSRTLEKLEIERCFYQRRNINWGIVTEQYLPMTLIYNVKWIHPYFRLVDLNPISESIVNQIASALTEKVLMEHIPLNTITHNCDAQLGLKRGCSLAVVRHLIANRFWQIDMNQPVRQREPLKLLNEPEGNLYNERMIA